MSQHHFLVVAGNIGVGKSTLVEGLARRLGWQAAFEPHAENPYLADFYQSMATWSFHSQTFFLSKRLEQHFRIGLRETSIIQDRSLYEDAEIFARNLFEQGHMSARDWRTYHELYSTMAKAIPAPDLVIYLRAPVSTLLERIAERSRGYEQSIPTEYLERLNELYDRWAAAFQLCPLASIDARALDWRKDDDLDKVVEVVRHRIGL
ncbi:MAG: deoxynucleoside kinase [Thermoflexales bacterium]